MEDDSGEGGNGQRDEADDDTEQASASGFFGANNRPCQQHEPEDNDGNFESVHCLCPRRESAGVATSDANRRMAEIREHIVDFLTLRPSGTHDDRGLIFRQRAKDDKRGCVLSLGGLPLWGAKLRAVRLI
jgi:hypothetical protein